MLGSRTCCPAKEACAVGESAVREAAAARTVTAAPAGARPRAAPLSARRPTVLLRSTVHGPGRIHAAPPGRLSRAPHSAGSSASNAVAQTILPAWVPYHATASQPKKGAVPATARGTPWVAPAPQAHANRWPRRPAASRPDATGACVTRTRTNAREQGRSARPLRKSPR